MTEQFTMIQRFTNQDEIVKTYFSIFNLYWKVMFKKLEKWLYLINTYINLQSLTYIWLEKGPHKVLLVFFFDFSQLRANDSSCVILVNDNDLLLVIMNSVKDFVLKPNHVKFFNYWIYLVFSRSQKRCSLSRKQRWETWT